MSDQIRVLHLIDHLGLGGSQTILLAQLDLRSPRVAAQVVALSARTLESTAARLRQAGVAHRSLGLSGPDLRLAPRLRALLAADRPDVLHTHLDVSNSLGPAVAWTLGRRRPALIRQVENDPWQHYHAWTRFGLWALAGTVDVHVAISASLGRSLAGLLRRARIEVVPPGIDRRRFDPARAVPGVVAELRGRARRVLGTVARLADQKAIDVLLDAVPALLAAEPATRVLIAGDGPRREALEGQARRLGVAGAVRFLGHRDDLASVYRALDVFILPSRHEGFGLVSTEAMAMGVPVVATRVIGSVDAVCDGVTGLLVPPDDPPALGRAILRLCADRPLRERMVRAARAMVLAERSDVAMARRVEALYDELLARRAR